MGADLYLRPLLEQQRSRYVAKFRQWASVRDQAATTVERTRAQQQVNHYFDRMYAKGYFRDNYNPSNLLAKFALSWWEDVTPRLDAEDQLDPTQMRWLLRTLKHREPVFKTNIATDPDRAFFILKYRELRTFLRTALKRNEPIECSL